jgi:hypothetical protein
VAFAAILVWPSSIVVSHVRVAKCELDSPNAGGRLLPRRCTLDVGPSMIPDLRTDVWSSIEILMELKFLPYVLIA